MKGVNCVQCAIDAGHGYTKALALNGARLVFPSLICPPPAHVDLGEFAPSDAMMIDGPPFLVGKPARAHATPLWSLSLPILPITSR